MELIANVKNYEWGKLGMSSIVAQLAAANRECFAVDNETAYSELWMGDHPVGPSLLKTTGSELGGVLREALPFLFKVLSIRKALSIQVHPNKCEALRLHNERPDVYRDPNHKPELAIALTPFTALCGFRPYAEIHGFCEKLPPLTTLLGGAEEVKVLKEGTGTTTDMRRLYERLMTSKPADTTRCINDITDNYSDSLVKCGLRDIYDKIRSDFPGDVGVLSLFFLNLITLKPGQSIFLPANEIHAYLSGDCIECMACSDNVIRAGLTPKFKDVRELISCLNYEGLPASSKLFQSKRLDEQVHLFAPPVRDFAVAEIKLSAAAADYKFKMEPHNSILLVLQGERMLRTSVNYDMNIKRGTIVYIPAEAAPHIEFIAKPDHNICEDFTAYIASVNYTIPKSNPDC